MKGTQLRLSAALGLMLGVLLVAAGCGGGGSGGVTPSAATLQGKITLPPGQSANDVVVRLEGTNLTARPRPDGTYVIENVPPGDYTVSAVAAGANLGAHKPVTVGNAAGMVEVPPMELVPAGQIAGIVTAYNSENVLDVRAGATIVARPVGIMALPASVRPGTAAEVPETDPDVALTATTDALGAYVLKGVTPGGYQVTATLQSFEPIVQWVWLEAGRTGVADFQFNTPEPPQPGTVTGVVTATVAGQEAPVPVVGATITADNDVVVRPPDGGGSSSGGPVVIQNARGARSRRMMPPYYGDYAVTDENGQYSLSVSAGEHVLYCRHREYQEAKATVTVAAGGTATANFQMKPSTIVRPRLSLKAATTHTEYAQGVPVEMSMTLTNTGTVPVTLSFDGSEAQFAVWRGDEIVWQYGQWGWTDALTGAKSRSRGRDVMIGILRPGESREYKVAWDQQGMDGQMAAAGEYSLHGQVVLSNLNVEAAPVSFTITAPAE